MRTITLKYRGDNRNLFGSIENYKADQCKLYQSGHSQVYNYGDISCSGEIFDFTYHYRESDRVLFHEEADGSFTPCNFYDIPFEGAERREYIFVFDVVEVDGELIALYDYFA